MYYIYQITNMINQKIYIGQTNKYSLIMPEVFTEENRKRHSKIGRTGERNGRAKLKEEDVLNIRRLHSEGTSNKEIYNLYPQVTTTSIRDIINNKTWKKFTLINVYRLSSQRRVK